MSTETTIEINDKPREAAVSSIFFKREERRGRRGKGRRKDLRDERKNDGRRSGRGGKKEKRNKAVEEKKAQLDSLMYAVMGMMTFTMEGGPQLGLQS